MYICPFRSMGFRFVEQADNILPILVDRCVRDANPFILTIKFLVYTYLLCVYEYIYIYIYNVKVYVCVDDFAGQCLNINSQPLLVYTEPLSCISPLRNN